MQAPRHSVWWKIHTGKSFFNAIRPAHVVPSRCKISEPLLDSKYDKIKVKTEATIAASNSVGLMYNEWSNIRNEPHH